MNYQEDLEKRSNIEQVVETPSFENVTLRLELSNICNHKCLFCPNSKMKRKRCYMDEKLIYRLLEEGRNLGEGRGIESVGLFMNGEPFISKNLSEYIKYAKEIGYKYVFITTNGALANADRLKSVMDAGLDSIKFSINAGSRDTYKLIHGKDDYNKVMENLKIAHQYKVKNKLDIKILSSFVVTKYTKDEIDIHYNNIKPYIDDIIFFYAESFGGQMQKEIKELQVDIDNIKVPKYKIPNKLPCIELFKTICVTAEGYLTLCCSEAFNYLVIEDVNSMSLSEAWHSERMKNIRQKHCKNDIEGMLCYNCIYGKNSEYHPINKELFELSYSTNADL